MHEYAQTSSKPQPANEAVHRPGSPHKDNEQELRTVHTCPLLPAKLREYVHRNLSLYEIIKGSLKHNGSHCCLCPFMCNDTREAMCIFRTAKKDWVEIIFNVGVSRAYWCPLQCLRSYCQLVEMTSKNPLTTHRADSVGTKTWGGGQT